METFVPFYLIEISPPPNRLLLNAYSASDLHSGCLFVTGVGSGIPNELE